MARLSVIITTYNRRKLLPKAIESVKNSGVMADIIVVDDASSDDTKEFCENVEGIRYIRLQNNQGTAAARNTGIQQSSTPLISFLDDDDWRLPGTYGQQLELLDRNEKCALVYGKVLYADQKHELTGTSNTGDPTPQGDVLIELLHRNFITLSTVVVRKECIVKAGMFDTSPKMLGLEDWDMWLRLATQYEVLAVNEPVAVYRKPEKDSGQWYSDMGRQFTMAASAYRKKWFMLPRLKEKLGTEFNSTKKKILADTSDIIMYGAVYNSKNFKDKASRFAAAAKCWSYNLVRIKFYKAFFKSFLSRQQN